MKPDAPPPNSEETRDLLKARAHKLAQPLETRETGSDALRVVEFVLAHERHAVETAFVREVCPLKDITPVPCTPAFVTGIINVRGRIVTVIDIKRFFDLPATGITDLNKVLIISIGNMEAGFLADAVIGERAIDLHELQTSLPTLTGIRAEYLRGITRERLVVLDAQKILSDRKILVDEEVETGNA